MYGIERKPEDLKRQKWGERDIVEEGYRESNGKWYINYSGALTRLIQEAGRWCERFASDLFIDWTYINQDLEDGSLDDRTYYFAFRRDGVDGETFLRSRMESDPWLHEYRAVWRMDVETLEFCGSRDKLRFTLYRVD